MVQVQYCCLSCFSTCSTYQKATHKIVDANNASSSASRIVSLILLIVDLFIKFYYLVFRRTRTLQLYFCYFFNQHQRPIFANMNHHIAFKYCDNNLPIPTSQQNNLVKVKKHKNDNYTCRNRVTYGSYFMQHGKYGKTSARILLLFLLLCHLVSTTQSITGKNSRKYKTFILCSLACIS